MSHFIGIKVLIYGYTHDNRPCKYASATCRAQSAHYDFYRMSRLEARHWFFAGAEEYFFTGYTRTKRVVRNGQLRAYPRLRHLEGPLNNTAIKLYRTPGMLQVQMAYMLRKV